MLIAASPNIGFTRSRRRRLARRRSPRSATSPRSPARRHRARRHHRARTLERLPEHRPSQPGVRPVSGRRCWCEGGWSRANAGSGFDELFATHSADVVAYCSWRAASASDAQDAAAEVFLTAWRCSTTCRRETPRASGSTRRRVESSLEPAAVVELVADRRCT